MRGASNYTNTSGRVVETSLGVLLQPGERVAVSEQRRVRTAEGWSAQLLTLAPAADGALRGFALDTSTSSGRQLLTFSGMAPDAALQGSAHEGDSALRGKRAVTPLAQRAESATTRRSMTPPWREVKALMVEDTTPQSTVVASLRSAMDELAEQLVRLEARAQLAAASPPSAGHRSESPPRSATGPPSPRERSPAHSPQARVAAPSRDPRGASLSLPASPARAPAHAAALSPPTLTAAAAATEPSAAWKTLIAEAWAAMKRLDFDGALNYFEAAIGASDAAQSNELRGDARVLLAMAKCCVHLQWHDEAHELLLSVLRAAGDGVAVEARHVAKARAALAQLSNGVRRGAFGAEDERHISRAKRPVREGALNVQWPLGTAAVEMWAALVNGKWRGLDFDGGVRTIALSDIAALHSLRDDDGAFVLQLARPHGAPPSAASVEIHFRCRAGEGAAFWTKAIVQALRQRDARVGVR